MRPLSRYRSPAGGSGAPVALCALVALLSVAPASAQMAPSPPSQATRISAPSPGAMCSQAGGQSALDVPMGSHAAGRLSYAIAVRQSFAFVLPFNAGTGYGWSVLKRPDPRVAEPIGIWTVGSADRPGGPGRAIVVSRGTGVGTTVFTVVYSRPWEHGVAPAKTVTVQVRVAKPPAGC